MQTQTFKVAGMTCGGCASSVTNAIQRIDGVKDVKVTLETGDVEILYNPNSISELELHDSARDAVEAAGFEIKGRDKVEDGSQQGGCCRC